MPINFEMRRNAAFLEQTQADTLAALQNPDMRVVLGIGHVANLESVVQRLYLPNVKNDEIKAPSRYVDTDDVPLLLGDIDKPYKIHPTLRGMTPYQQTIMGSIMKSWKGNAPEYVSAPDVEFTDLLLQEYTRSVNLGYDVIWLNEAMAGSVQSPIMLINFSAQRFPDAPRQPIVVRGRPIMSITNVTKSEGSRPALMSLLVHEADHVSQFESVPTTLLDRYADVFYRRELAAYATSAEFSEVLVESPNSPFYGDESALDEYDVIANDARKAVAHPKDPYRPTPEVRQAIDAIGFSGAFECSTEILDALKPERAFNW